MTILAALARRHGRATHGAADPRLGFAPAKIHYTAVLDPSGAIVAIDPAPRDGKRLLREPIAPQPPKRTVAVMSGTLWDKTSYVFGRTTVDPATAPERQARDLARCAQEHAAFKARHEALLSGTDDVGCLALLLFLRSWDPAHYDALDHASAMLDQNVAFRLDGEIGFLHDRPAVGVALTAERAGRPPGDQSLCLVTGELEPIARLHPSIKGVPGAQSSGASLVSFNLDAFNSYGRLQGLNAPVGESSAEAYGAALNALLAAEIGKDPVTGRSLWSNRIGLGDDTVVFWAERPEAEPILRGMLEPPTPPEDDLAKPTKTRSTLGKAAKPCVTEDSQTKHVREVLQRIERGEPISKAVLGTRPDTKVYLLGLSPNAARLSVRFWREGTLGDLARRVKEHWDDMRLEPAPRQSQPPVWALLYELAPLRKVDDGLRQLAGEWLRAVLSGGDYPASLLAQALMRVRAEHAASPLRVAIIKAVLTRRARKHWEQTRPEDRTLADWKDPWMSLTLKNPQEGQAHAEANLGYRLGRLFAVLEAAQYAGLGRRVNAGVRDKFFGSASATPRHVFPSLLRGAQDHLAAARKRNRGGRANRLDGDIREILGGMESPGLFPAVLAPDAQGAFVVGFYHQDAELRVPRVKDETIDTSESPADDNDGDA